MNSRLFRYARTFWVAGTISIAALVMVWYWLGFNAAFIALLLIILEVTFSFENAVINARVLKLMSKFWQQIFLTIGILVAVFGMRIVFPIILVAITAQLPAQEVLNLAFNQPERYSEYLEAANPTIAAFGGMFLLMVFLHFFLFENNENRWIKRIEHIFDKLPRTWFTMPALALIVLAIVALSSGALMQTVFTAGAVGIIVYMVMRSLVTYMQSRHLADKATRLVGFGGFVGFLYLEILDASFSLDGVIGAFAITSSVILIAAGLGVGAVWVRSMTVYLVRHETLMKYVHLEQGAHYAIGILATVLLVSIFLHVPEAVTGLLGVSVIIASIVSSKRKRTSLELDTKSS